MVVQLAVDECTINKDTHTCNHKEGEEYHALNKCLKA